MFLLFHWLQAERVTSGKITVSTSHSLIKSGVCYCIPDFSVTFLFQELIICKPQLKYNFLNKLALLINRLVRADTFFFSPVETDLTMLPRLVSHSWAQRSFHSSLSIPGISHHTRPELIIKKINLFLIFYWNRQNYFETIPRINVSFSVRKSGQGSAKGTEWKTGTGREGSGFQTAANGWDEANYCQAGGGPGNHDRPQGSGEAPSFWNPSWARPALTVFSHGKAMVFRMFMIFCCLFFSPMNVWKL